MRITFKEDGSFWTTATVERDGFLGRVWPWHAEFVQEAGDGTLWYEVLGDGSLRMASDKMRCELFDAYYACRAQMARAS